MKRLEIYLLALLLLPGLAGAATQVDETRSVDPDARIEIETVSGSVRVTGWGQNEVHVKGSIGDDAEGLEIEGGGGNLTIEVEIPRQLGRGKHDVDAHLEIMVPTGARVSVETVSASIEATGLAGRMVLESVSGSLEASGTPEAAELSSVSGSIRFSGEQTRVTAESVSGNVILEGVSGVAEVSTVSGNIKVEADELDRGTFESVAGTIEVTGRPANGARLDFEAHSSNIVLNLPADVSAYFEVETFSGHIDNELGPEAKRTGKYAPGKSLEFTAGSGDARVSIETFSGNVSLRTQ